MGLEVFHSGLSQTPSFFAIGSAWKYVNVVYGLNIRLVLQVESSNDVLETPQCLGFSRPSCNDGYRQ